MNFTIEAKELQTELNKAKKIMNSVHAPLSAARAILFEAEEDKLFMNINNLETEYRTELDAQIIRTGKALIDFKILNDIVSGFEEEIEFDEEESRWFSIKSGKSSSHVVGLDTDDFPAMLITEEYPVMPGFINAHELCRVFKNAAVLKSSSEERRHHLKTILLEEREPGKLLVKSTDSASLYVGEVERTGDTELTYHLVDKKAALAVTDILKSFGTKDVEVSIAENRLFIDAAVSQKTFTGKREKRASICLRFVDGNWPNTDTIFTSFCAAEFTVEKPVFTKALKKAKAFVNTEYKAGIFVFNRASEFTITVTNPDIGECMSEVKLKDDIDIKEEVTELEIAYDVNKLLATTNILKCKTLKCRLVGTTKNKFIIIEDAHYPNEQVALGAMLA